MNIHWPVWAFFSRLYFEIQSRDVAVQRLYDAAQRPKSQRNAQNRNVTPQNRNITPQNRNITSKITTPKSHQNPTQQYRIFNNK